MKDIDILIEHCKKEPKKIHYVDDYKFITICGKKKLYKKTDKKCCVLL